MLNYKLKTNSVIISVYLSGMKNPSHSLFSIREYHYSNTTLTTQTVFWEISFQQGHYSICYIQNGVNSLAYLCVVYTRWLDSNAGTQRQICNN